MQYARLTLYVMVLFSHLSHASFSKDALHYLEKSHKRIGHPKIPQLEKTEERLLYKLCKSPFLKRLGNILLNSDGWVKPVRCITVLSASLDFARFISHMKGGLPATLAALFMSVTIPALHCATKSMLPTFPAIRPLEQKEFFRPPTSTLIHFDALRERTLQDMEGFCIHAETFSLLTNLFVQAYQLMREPLKCRYNLYSHQPITIWRLPFTHNSPPYTGTLSMLPHSLYPVHSFDLCCTLALSENYPLLPLYGKVATYPDTPWVSFVSDSVYGSVKEVEQSFAHPAKKQLFRHYKNGILTKELLPLLKKDPLSFDDKSLLFALLDKKD